MTDIPDPPEREPTSREAETPENPTPRPPEVPLACSPGPLSVADALLKHPSRIIHELCRERCGQVTVSMLAVAIVSLAGYGLTVGVFSGGTQLWAAPAKIVLGALLTIVICFPSLAIFSCLAGVDTRPGLIAGGLVALVCLYSILLVGFAPVSWVFSQATDSVVFMGVIHLIFWSIGLYYGMRFLFRAFGFGNGRGLKHLVFWATVFVVVSLQMTTFLRPIIGTSDTFLTSEKKLFVEHWVETIEPGLPD